MAGSGAAVGFSATGFRDAIHFAMSMGAANDTNKRITFRWLEKDTFAIQDPATRPYDWTAPITTAQTVTDFQVLCAVEFHAGGAKDETIVGTFNETSIVLTLLDTEYASVLAHGNGRFPDLVKADDDVYEIRYIPPPVGLFDVDVWSVYCVARSET